MKKKKEEMKGLEKLNGDKKDFTKKVILSIMFLSVIVMGLYAYSIDSQWQYDSIALFALTVILTLLYKRVKITIPGLLLAFLAIALHGLGIFGWYEGAPLGISYDHYTHFFSGVALGVIIYSYLERYHSNKDYENIHKAAVIIMTLFLVSGLGNVVEVAEYGGYRFFGEGDGMFFYGAGDGGVIIAADNVPGEWDNTIKDMIFNFLGGVLAVVIMQFDFLWKRREDNLKRIGMKKAEKKKTVKKKKK